MIEGLNELDQKLVRLADASGKLGRNAAANAIKHVQARAKSLSSPEDTGELRNSIRTSAKETEKGVIAVCYTNVPHATYVEFGTGPKGQKNHEGISPEVTPVYTQKAWWIPESDSMTPEKAEKYHFMPWTFRLDGYLEYEKTFYKTSGQPARPFMYPALKDGEKEVLNAIKLSAVHTIGGAIK